MKLGINSLGIPIVAGILTFACGSPTYANRVTLDLVRELNVNDLLALQSGIRSFEELTPDDEERILQKGVDRRCQHWGFKEGLRAPKSWAVKDSSTTRISFTAFPSGGYEPVLKGHNLQLFKPWNYRNRTPFLKNIKDLDLLDKLLALVTTLWVVNEVRQFWTKEDYSFYQDLLMQDSQVVVPTVGRIFSGVKNTFYRPWSGEKLLTKAVRSVREQGVELENAIGKLGRLEREDQDNKPHSIFTRLYCDGDDETLINYLWYRQLLVSRSSMNQKTLRDYGDLIGSYLGGSRQEIAEEQKARSKDGEDFKVPEAIAEVKPESKSDSNYINPMLWDSAVARQVGSRAVAQMEYQSLQPNQIVKMPERNDYQNNSKDVASVAKKKKLRMKKNRRKNGLLFRSARY